MKKIYYLTLMTLAIPYFSHGASYKNILKEMSKITSSYEGVTQISIGKNDQKQDMIALVIEYPNSSPVKTNHLVVGTHHGNERHAAFVPLEFAKDLINVYQDSTHPYFERFKKMKFFVLPVLNIGGFNSNDRYERTSSRQTQDPNRDYPDPCANKKDFNLKSTYNVASLVRNENIISAITVHGYIGTFTYPWGYYTDNWNPHEQVLMRQVALKASEKTGYRIGTHGEEIYPSAGGFEDWAHYELGVWSFLSELDYSPSYQKNSLSYLDFFANVPLTLSRNHSPSGKCTRTFTMETMPPSRP